jgi:hypothetical protein
VLNLKKLRNEVWGGSECIDPHTVVKSGLLSQLRHRDLVRGKDPSRECDALSTVRTASAQQSVGLHVCGRKDKAEISNYISQLV